MTEREQKKLRERYLTRLYCPAIRVTWLILVLSSRSMWCVLKAQTWKQRYSIGISRIFYRSLWMNSAHDDHFDLISANCCLSRFWQEANEVKDRRGGETGACWEMDKTTSHKPAEDRGKKGNHPAVMVQETSTHPPAPPSLIRSFQFGLSEAAKYFF